MSGRQRSCLIMSGTSGRAGMVMIVERPRTNPCLTPVAAACLSSVARRVTTETLRRRREGGSSNYCDLICWAAAAPIITH